MMVENIGDQPREDLRSREYTQTGYLLITRRADQGVIIEPDIDVRVIHIDGSNVLLDINHPRKSNYEDYGELILLECDKKCFLDLGKVVILNMGNFGISCIKWGYMPRVGKLLEKNCSTGR